MKKSLLDKKYKDINRILVIRIGSIGDAIMSTPALTALRTAYPDAWITLLTSSAAAPLFEEDPRLNELLTFDRRDMKAASKVIDSELKPLENLLRAKNFDLAVDLRGNGLTARLAYKSGAGLRAGFHSLQRGLFFGFRYNIKAKPPEPTAHRVELAWAVVAPLGIKYDFPPEINVPEADMQWAEKFLAEHGIADVPLLAVQPGASEPQKCWPVEQFHEVALKAINSKFGVVVLGTPDQEEAINLVEMGKGRFVSAVGATNPRQLAAIIKKADVFLGNDSGPAHLAAAVGTPAVVIFLATDPRRYGPYGEGHKVFTSPSSSDEVWEEIISRIKANAG